MNELDEVANRLLRLTTRQEQRERLQDRLRDTELVLRAVYLSGSLPVAKRTIKNWFIDQKITGKPGPLDFEEQDKLADYSSWVQDTLVLLRQFTEEHTTRSGIGLCECGRCVRYQELLARSKQLTKPTTT